MTPRIVKCVLLWVVMFIFCGNSSAQNVMIGNLNSPNEPSINMLPDNPDIMVAAANINNVYHSTDGGKSWEHQLLTSPFGVWGDPVLDVDTAGHFYFFHLSNTPGATWIDRIVNQKSTDGGKTWSDGTYTGLSGIKNQDKQWSAIDRRTNAIYLTWTQFDKYGSTAANDNSKIMFSKSLDSGATWSTAKSINEKDGNCVDSDLTVEGAVPAIGPNGEIYVAWAGPEGIVFDRSKDGGDTWLDKDIFVDNIPGGWDFEVPGIYRCNGLPITKCDTSGGQYHGTIYVNWTDQRNGEDDTDVWIRKSIDGGDTWSDIIKVNNDDSGKHQFFSWMDIDQTTGDLYFVFYDRRNYTDIRTDVYIAKSTDGGSSFENYKISESPFIPNKNIFFGDYNNIVAHDGVVRPIWTRLHQGQLSVWTDVTPQTFWTATKEAADTSIQEAIIYPTPSHEKSYVSFKLHKDAEVSVALCNPSGSIVRSIVSKEIRGYGKHIIQIPLEEMNLQTGRYFVRLSIGNEVKTLQSIVIE